MLENFSFSGGVIILISSFVLLLVGVVVTYFWLVRKYLAMQHEQGERGLELAKVREQVFQDAQQQAGAILADAQKKAQDIIKGAEFFENQQKAEVDKVLQTATHQFANAYKILLDEASKNTSKTLQSISDDIKNAVLAEVRGFTEKMQEEAKGTVSSIYRDIELEINAYKQQRLKQIDTAIIQIIEETAQKVVGKELSLEEHEKLVLKALEEAKRQNILLETKSETEKNT